ncbi:MAG TPA: aspartate carbamoyltransferase catalytic subunit [Armatimonadetes bacterium]|nr:aspartate carbamoyltransferase catalytic subunit [Armatimonadota bacterium]
MAVTIGDLRTKFARRHVLGLEDWGREEILAVLDLASEVKRRGMSPPEGVDLSGRALCTAFFEPSTRTRLSFEAAAKILGMRTGDLSVEASSVRKGESLKDTILTLEAMGFEVIVIRHRFAGAPHLAARWARRAHIVNGGDGCHEHPTQGLLDALTIRERMGGFKGLKVAIVGDILHSRVARSNLWALRALGAQVISCGPPTLCPKSLEALGAKVTHSLAEALSMADVVNVLRIQRERQQAGLIPSLKEYHNEYAITRRRLEEHPNVKLVMHPGPMNRGVEIDPDVADDERVCSVTEQVANGLAVRVALLALLLGGEAA